MNEKIFYQLLAEKVDDALKLNEDFEKGVNNLPFIDEMLKQEDPEIQLFTKKKVNEKFEEYVKSSYDTYVKRIEYRSHSDSASAAVNALLPYAGKKISSILKKIEGSDEIGRKIIVDDVYHGYSDLEFDVKFFGIKLDSIKVPMDGKEIYVSQYQALQNLRNTHNDREYDVAEGNVTSLRLKYVHSDTDYGKVAKEFLALKDLESLEIINTSRDKKLGSIPKDIFQLLKLKELSLLNNSLTIVPAEIKKLSALEKLYLSHNNFSEFPEQLTALRNLQLLTLSWNKLCKIPESIGKLTSLKNLYFNENNLSELPKNIGKLVNLTELQFDTNKINALPDEIGNLSLLNRLCMKENPIEKLPPTFTQLNNLENLYFSYTFHKEVSKLKNLKEMQITDVNSSLKNIGNLQMLDTLVMDSKQHEFPREILELCQLKSLELSYEINDVPKDIIKLSQLEKLSFDDSYFKSIPMLSGLNKLIQISFTNNYIKELPENLKEYLPESLKFIDFANNYIKKIPKSILEFPSLKGVYLYGNPLSKESQKILIDLKEKGCQVIYDKEG
jgi:Leucine-rich repeat (LRR) protein